MSNSYKVYASQEYVDNKIQEIDTSVDWNAKEGEPGYVENRTHYADLIKEDIIIFGPENYKPTSETDIFSIRAPIDLIEGARYVVTLDDESYESRAFNHPNGLTCLGNGNVYENNIGNSTGEYTNLGDLDVPFFLHTTGPLTETIGTYAQILTSEIF